MPRIPNIPYRIKQFQRAMRPEADSVPFDTLRAHLNPAQLTLFLRLQASEQLHAYSVFQRLIQDGYNQPDLLTAALLHDIGKMLYPLSPWERALIVLGNKFFPGLARRWGKDAPVGLNRPFAVAAQHPTWGADLVEQTGASRQTLDLIRHHQDRRTEPEIPLLGVLQRADDSN